MHDVLSTRGLSFVYLIRGVVIEWELLSQREGRVKHPMFANQSSRVVSFTGSYNTPETWQTWSLHFAIFGYVSIFIVSMVT